MQYPESTSVGVVQAWPEPGSLKPRGGHHLEPQGSRAYSSAVPRVISLHNSVTLCSPRNCPQFAREPLARRTTATLAQSRRP